MKKFNTVYEEVIDALNAEKKHPNLKNVAGSATSIIDSILDKVTACTSASEVFELLKKAFADAGLDTQWTKTFLDKLSKMKSLEKAWQLVFNAWQSGQGDKVIR